MSDPQRPPAPAGENRADKAPRGVNLALIYGIMVVALLLAIGLATLIIQPFYHGR